MPEFSEVLPQTSLSAKDDSGGATRARDVNRTWIMGFVVLLQLMSTMRHSLDHGDQQRETGGYAAILLTAPGSNRFQETRSKTAIRPMSTISSARFRTRRALTPTGPSCGTARVRPAAPGPAPGARNCCFKPGQLIAERKESLARDMTREMGKVLDETRGDVQEAIDMTFFMAGEGRRQYGQTVPSELRDKFAMSIRQPLGVWRP